MPRHPLSPAAQLKLLRVFGICEGISFLVLLFIAMPLKYAFGLPAMVHLVGSLHGGLFVLYVLAVLGAGPALGWRPGLMLGGLLSAIFPFGPFIYEAHLRKRQLA